MTVKNPLLYQKQISILIKDIQQRLADKLKLQSQPGGVGLAMARLFGRMAEVIANRLNQAPEQHFRAFLNEAEIDRRPPLPAHTELTFTPAPDAVAATRVPLGTQVATRPSATQPEIIFETEREMTVIPTGLTGCITVDPVNYSVQTARATGGGADSFPAFAGETERERIFYLDGNPLLIFSDASSRAHATFTLTFTFVDQIQHATDGWVLEWLYWAGADPNQARWASLQDAGALITDQTENFRKDGTVQFRKLPALTVSEVNGQKGIWLACKLTGGNGRQQLPTVRRVTMERVIVTDPIFAFLDVPSPDREPITLTFTFAQPLPANSPKVEWLYWDSADPDHPQWLGLKAVGALITDTTVDFQQDGAVEFRKLPKVARTEVNGEPGVWLACKLVGGADNQPLPIFKSITGGRVIRASEEIKPNAAFAMIQAGSAFIPLDLSNTCSPLGQQPAQLDTFFLRVDEAFTKQGATITLKLDLQELPSELEDMSELEKLELEWAYASPDGWTVLGKTKRGCPALEKLNFEDLENPNSGATLFPKPTLQKTPFIGGKYLEFAVPDAYREASIEQLPYPFSQGKLITDIYTGAKYVQIQIPDECKSLPDDRLINGCSAAERLNFKDKTCALTSTGVIQFTIPVESAANPQFVKDPEFVKTEVNGQMGYWVRARMINGSYNVPQKAKQNLLAKTLMASPPFLPPLVYAPVLQKFQVFYRDYQQRDPARLVTRGHSKTDQRWQNHAPTLETRQLFSPFRAAIEEPALYLGFAPFISDPLRVAFPAGKWIQIRVDVDEAGGKQMQRMVLNWEYWDGNRWHPLRVADGTLGFSRQEYLSFLAPSDHQPSVEFGFPAYWLRIRPPENPSAMIMPRLKTLRLNTVPAVNAETILDELLGFSTGEPSQRFTLAKAPVLSDLQIEVLEPELHTGNAGDESTLAVANGTAPAIVNGTTARTFEAWVAWQPVSSFHFCGPESRCYILDAINGEVRFGNGKRGKIPPIGSNNIRAKAYRIHSGVTGNAAAGAVNVLRNPSGDLGGIRSVTNFEAAVGGLDPELVDQTKRLGPQRLKHRERSVTLEDFQWLTLEADDVARAYCLPTRDPSGARQPGWVSMVVVPQSIGQGQTAMKPLPTRALLQQVGARLEDVALVNLRPFEDASDNEPTQNQVNDVDQIYVKGPAYVEVAVQASVVPNKPAQADDVKIEILKRLEQFFHPLSGGPTQAGWEPGRDVYISEVAAEIENVAGVDHVAEINLQATSMQQQCLKLAAELSAPLDLPAGSQVSTFDERIKMILAQSLAQDQRAQQLNVYGFNSGEFVKIVAEDNSILAENQMITQLGDDGNIVTFDQPTPDPTQWPQPAFAVVAMNERVRLEINQCLFVYDEKGQPRLTGFGLQSFEAGDRISVVVQECRRQRIDFLTITAVAPGAGLTRIFVPADRIVCSGVHRIQMVLGTAYANSTPKSG